MRSRKKNALQGVVVYDGESLLDGERIVCLVSGVTVPSQNSKTGGMLQTWILRADQPPLDAARTGADRSVCGDCPLRGAACYVQLHRGPRAVFAAWQRGEYLPVARTGWSWADGRPVRFGAYGDPAAVPMEVWFKLAARASRWTGYTRYWRDRERQPLRYLMMASVDNELDAWKAHRAGWRSYRIRLPTEALLPFESRCPAATESGERTTCLRCAQCDGTRHLDLRRSYSVIAHGPGAGVYERSRLRVL